MQGICDGRIRRKVREARSFVMVVAREVRKEVRLVAPCSWCRATVDARTTTLFSLPPRRHSDRDTALALAVTIDGRGQRMDNRCSNGLSVSCGLARLVLPSSLTALRLFST